MRRIAPALCLALIACGPPAEDNGGGGTADAGAPAEPAGPQINFSCPDGAPSITNGTNDSWPYGAGPSGDRKFHAQIPTIEDGAQLGVVFSWHGIGNSLESWVDSAPMNNSESDFPFIIISPHDSGMQPQEDPPGLYWDMLYSSPGDENREAALFESVLACLMLDYPIDKQRIYSLGFSGGAVTTNMLQVRYPDLFAATAPMSGAWFSDPAQEDLVDPTGRGAQFFPGLGVDWNDMGPGQETILITHGGPNDDYGMLGVQVINFDSANLAAIDYLTANGRNVIDCPHQRGHLGHPDFWTAELVGFMKAHRWHEPSPYVDGLPEPFSGAGCQFYPAASP